MRDSPVSNAQLFDVLRRGLANDRLVPWFQPVMDPTATRLFSAEALPRMVDPDLGVIAPEVFLDVASRHGMLGRVGEVLLAKTCSAFAIWKTRDLAPEMVSVNLSGTDLLERGALERILNAVAGAGMKPANLGIEVAPDIATGRGGTEILKISDAFARMGIRMIADDLGAYPVEAAGLAPLRVSAAKIDRATIMGLGVDEDAATRVWDLVGIASDLDIPLIAKGVENRAQIDLLNAAGCAGQQGFAIARPMPLNTFTEWLDLNTRPRVGMSDAA